MDFAAIIVAAGRGERAGGAKQWRDLGGKAVARWSLEALLTAGATDAVVVIPPDDEAKAQAAFAGLGGWRSVPGGAERFDSVRAGLDAIGEACPEAVLIHDAARPFLDPKLIVRLVQVLDGADAAIPALGAVDTLKRLGPDGQTKTADRTGLWRAQTPQAFRLGLFRAAVAGWVSDAPPTDDAQVAERAGLTVKLVDGDPRLFKLTHPEDFAMAEALAFARPTRIGQGFDVHAFCAGDRVRLCGIEIAHERGLAGHSDADAGLHALTDALLATIGAGDIGDHFPPTDPQWKGADSAVFLRHAAALIARRGGHIVNVDVTLICESPKIKPHRQAMRARLAELLEIDIDAVSVKATTTEKLGFAGRGEGIASLAVAAIQL
ncbi:MAG TPA: bifunctional 2-C-methyl-D-erythritol 4-phosphate cytidylyltransferase/2-C-methyl-D-erythritol 2,4-cyclodiphosphate synthase [Caulobacteraceae bacterium]